MKRVELFRVLLATLVSVVTANGLTGCMAVGYSSGGGWFIWPGGLGLVLIVLLVLLVLRRR